MLSQIRESDSGMDRAIAIGRIVKRLRVQRDWNQDHLGSLVGRTRTRISDLERGARVDLRTSEIATFAKAFGLETAELSALFDAEAARPLYEANADPTPLPPLPGHPGPPAPRTDLSNVQDEVDLSRSVDIREVRGSVSQPMLPVYASAQGGTEGEMIISYDPVDWLPMPASLARVPGAFACYVVGDSMSPRFEPGEQIWVNPGKRPRPRDYVIIVLDDGAGTARCLVKRFIRETPSEVIVEEFQPVQRQFGIPRADVRQIMLIVGANF